MCECCGKPVVHHHGPGEGHCHPHDHKHDHEHPHQHPHDHGPMITVIEVAPSKEEEADS